MMKRSPHQLQHQTIGVSVGGVICARFVIGGIGGGEGDDTGRRFKGGVTGVTGMDGLLPAATTTKTNNNSNKRKIDKDDENNPMVGNVKPASFLSVSVNMTKPKSNKRRRCTVNNKGGKVRASHVGKQIAITNGQKGKGGVTSPTSSSTVGKLTVSTLTQDPFLNELYTDHFQCISDDLELFNQCQYRNGEELGDHEEDVANDIRRRTRLAMKKIGGVWKQVKKSCP